MKRKIYTYKVIRGKFKGKIVRSYAHNCYVDGISASFIACFDDEHDYVLFCNDLKMIGNPEEVEIREE